MNSTTNHPELTSENQTAVDAIEKTLRLLQSPGDVFEIRCLRVPGYKGSSFTASGYFDNPRAGAVRAAAMESQRPGGIYVTINPVVPQLLSRASNRIQEKPERTTTDAEIAQRRWLFIDVDSTKPAGVSATDEQLSAAQVGSEKVADWLSTNGFPEPVIAMSGNGYHLLVPIDLAADDESTRLCQSILKVAAAECELVGCSIDQSTFNAARIIRLWGSVARKGDHTELTPHRRSAIVWVPDYLADGWNEPTPLATLQRVAERDDKSRHQVGVELNISPPAGVSHHATADEVVRDAKAYVAKMPPAIEGQDGSGVTIRTMCRLLREFDPDLNQMLTILEEWNARCQPPWSQKELEHKYEAAYQKTAGEERGRKRRNRNQKSDRVSGSVDDQLALKMPDELDPTLEENRTDSANGRRLIAAFGRELRFVGTWKSWLWWDGARWKIDEVDRVEHLAKRVINTELSNYAGLLRKARKELSGDKENKELQSRVAMLEVITKFFCRSANMRGVRDLVAAARSEPELAVTHDSLDMHPWKLNLLNGTINLKTWRVGNDAIDKHDRNDLITQLCPVTYDPTAACPRWEAFVFQIMDGRQDLVDYLMRLVGSWLVGEVRENQLPIFYGSGANGKSVLVGVVQSVLGGDYSMKAPASMLIANRGERHPTELADLFRRRFVASVESPEGGRLDETLVKELTGNDIIRARRMRENFWEFRPSHKLILVSNHKPIVSGTDAGIWRRLKLIPFEVQIPKEHQDPNLLEKLSSERSGILNWMLRGMSLWRDHGLAEPAEVTAASEQYRTGSDLLGQFLAECCVRSGEVSETAGRLLDAYNAWFGGKLGPFRFRKLMETKGYFPEKIGNRSAYRGMALHSSLAIANQGCDAPKGWSSGRDFDF